VPPHSNVNMPTHHDKTVSTHEKHDGAPNEKLEASSNAASLSAQFLMRIRAGAPSRSSASMTHGTRLASRIFLLRPGRVVSPRSHDHPTTPVTRAGASPCPLVLCGCWPRPCCTETEYKGRVHVRRRPRTRPRRANVADTDSRPLRRSINPMSTSPPSYRLLEEFQRSRFRRAPSRRRAALRQTAQEAQEQFSSRPLRPRRGERLYPLPTRSTVADFSGRCNIR